MFLYFLVAVIALAISIVLCSTFARIAAAKGYSYQKYFGICFFLGMIGYIMVAALPDDQLLSQIEQAIRKAAPPEDGSWKCKCGRVNPPYVSSCSCGTNKRDI